jgi:NADPH2:quinone reductase
LKDVADSAAHSEGGTKRARRPVKVLRSAAVRGAIGGTLPTIPASSLFGLKSVMGVGMLGWRAARPGQAKADVAEVAELWRAGNLRTAVDASYPLEKIQQIHEILDRRANQGRLIAMV